MPQKQHFTPLVPLIRTSSKDENLKMTPNVVGMIREKLGSELLAAGVEEKHVNMRLNQLWKWVYEKGVTDFSSMTNISKDFRDFLGARFFIGRPQIVEKLISKDGTRKYLLKLDDDSEVETVFIPEKDRGTLCVSSQVGCTLNCSFCFTGTQKLVRNLSASEIVGQVLVVRDDLNEWSLPKRQNSINRKITNVVMMGMGEPLYNFDAVKDALHIIMDNEGISLSRKRITLSTSGVVPKIAQVGSEIGCLLAISFHATTDKIRDELVPINKKWNISQLLGCLRSYPTLSNSQRITFEYVMLKNINDSDADAKRLVKLISGIPAKINLIPFNSWPGSPYERSSAERTEAFAKIVNRAGYASPIRSPRGEDILAACGQLKSASVKKIIPKAENYFSS